MQHVLGLSSVAALGAALALASPGLALLASALALASLRVNP